MRDLGFRSQSLHILWLITLFPWHLFTLTLSEIINITYSLHAHLKGCGYSCQLHNTQEVTLLWPVMLHVHCNITCSLCKCMKIHRYSSQYICTQEVTLSQSYKTNTDHQFGFQNKRKKVFLKILQNIYKKKMNTALQNTYHQHGFQKKRKNVST